jgi:hypothetical protein
MKLILLFLVSLAAGFQQELKPRTILDGKVTILVPTDFKEMGPEMLNFKYKGKNVPTFVLTDSNAAVNLAFNHLPNKAEESSIELYKNSVKSSLEKSFPDATWMADGVRKMNGKTVGFMKLMTNAIDTRVYNYFILTDCEGRLLIATFNCTEKRLPQWEQTAEKIMESFKVN